MVADDGAQCIAIVSLDLLFLTASTVAELKKVMTEGTELNPDAVMIACTHTHRGPFTTALMDEETNWTYIDFLHDRLSVGIKGALNERAPARLKVGRINAPGWTFNRRPVYRGEQVGTQGPAWSEDFLRMEGPTDDDLQVVLAESLDGTTLGGLVCFACHTTVMGTEHVYSADYAGALTEELSARYGGTFAFLLGACGNLWAWDLSLQPSKSQSGPDHARRMAKGLADKADVALTTGRSIVDGHVHVARAQLHIPQRRPTREQVTLARWYLEEAPPDVNEHSFTRLIYEHDYTFYGNHPVIQQWFAREIIGMWEWQRRAGTRELMEEIDIQVITVGDIAFVAYPVELFTEFGIQTKAQSPFADTFVVSLANGWHGYVPTLDAFAHGGYEPRLAYQSRLIPDAGDRMTTLALRLLKQLAPIQNTSLHTPDILRQPVHDDS